MLKLNTLLLTKREYYANLYNGCQRTIYKHTIYYLIIMNIKICCKNNNNVIHRYKQKLCPPLKYS